MFLWTFLVMVVVIAMITTQLTDYPPKWRLPLYLVAWLVWGVISLSLGFVTMTLLGLFFRLGFLAYLLLLLSLIVGLIQVFLFRKLLRNNRYLKE